MSKLVLVALLAAGAWWVWSRISKWRVAHAAQIARARKVRGAIAEALVLIVYIPGIAIFWVVRAVYERVRP